MDEGKTVGVVYMAFKKAFRHCFPQHFLGETGGSWLGRAYSLLGCGQICEVQQRQIAGPALGSRQPLAALQAGGKARSLPIRKDMEVLVDSD